jgi:hypothetical protein
LEVELAPAAGGERPRQDGDGFFHHERSSRAVGWQGGHGAMLRRALERAKSDAVDEQRTPTQRIQDIRLLGLGSFQAVGPTLRGSPVVHPPRCRQSQQPNRTSTDTMRLAAITAARRSHDDAGTDKIFARAGSRA